MSDSRDDQKTKVKTPEEIQEEKNKRDTGFFKNIVEVYTSEEVFLTNMSVLCYALKLNLHKFKPKESKKLQEFLAPYEKLSLPHADSDYTTLRSYHDSLEKYKMLEKLLDVDGKQDIQQKKIISNEMQEIVNNVKNEFNSSLSPLNFTLMQQDEKFKAFTESAINYQEFSKYLHSLKSTKENEQVFLDIQKDLIILDKKSRGEELTQKQIADIDPNSGKALHDYIIQPIQRIPRYDILIKGAMDRTDESLHESFKNFHEKVKMQAKKIEDIKAATAQVTLTKEKEKMFASIRNIIAEQIKFGTLTTTDYRKISKAIVNQLEKANKNLPKSENEKNMDLYLAYKTFMNQLLKKDNNIDDVDLRKIIKAVEENKYEEIDLDIDVNILHIIIEVEINEKMVNLFGNRKDRDEFIDQTAAKTESIEWVLKDNTPAPNFIPKKPTLGFDEKKFQAINNIISDVKKLTAYDLVEIPKKIVNQLEKEYKNPKLKEEEKINLYSIYTDVINHLENKYKNNTPEINKITAIKTAVENNEKMNNMFGNTAARSIFIKNIKEKKNSAANANTTNDVSDKSKKSKKFFDFFNKKTSNLKNKAQKIKPTFKPR